MSQQGLSQFLFRSCVAQEIAVHSTQASLVPVSAGLPLIAIAFGLVISLRSTSTAKVDCGNASNFSVRYTDLHLQCVSELG